MRKWLQDAAHNQGKAVGGDSKSWQAADDPEMQYMSNTYTYSSSKEQISAKEAAVALEYIDNVKQLRDATAELEQECEENRQECSRVKVRSMLERGY